MILSRSTKEHAGKCVRAIRSDDGSDKLVMCETVTIEFTDGSEIRLACDWRGGECYISEYTNARKK